MSSWSFGYLRDGYQEADPELVRALRLITGLSEREAAAQCRTPWNTFRRWLKDRPAPPLVVRHLAVLGGFMPWDGWQDWYVANGELHLPPDHRYSVRPSEILSIPYLRGVATEYQRLRQQTLEDDKIIALPLSSSNRTAAKRRRVREG